MEMVQILVNQVITMFILAGIGAIMFRTGKITKAGSVTLANILIYLSLPAVIINGFQLERTAEHLTGLAVSTVAAFLIMLVSILMSRLCFRKDAIATFAGTFSNPGFFGIPLIVASLRPEAVFYVAPFIAMVNLLQWTYGVHLLTGKEEKKQSESSGRLAFFKRVVTAPFMVAILIGLFFFLTGIPIPGIAAKCVSFLAGLNTPVAMYTVGIYLAQTDVVGMFRKGVLYQVSAVRLLLIPIVSFLVLWLFPASMLEMKLALLIAIACPVGSNIAVYAQLYEKDYPYAVETVVISTLFSVLTIPALTFLAQRLWG